MDALIVVFIGIVFGVLYRTWQPYQKKRREAEEQGKEFTFDKDYLITMVEALAFSVALAVMLIGQVQIPLDIQSNLLLLSFGFTTGYTSNSVLNQQI
jgi:uncharacterized membrane protein YjgN (DUF898 family)